MAAQVNANPADYVSAFAFAPTVERLSDAIAKAGLTIFARIDHAAAAHEIGLTLPPTLVLIYGNPKGGTLVMQKAPQTALDLPLRVLVRQDADGRALVSFHPVVEMLGRLGAPADLVARLEPAQHLLVEAIK